MITPDRPDRPDYTVYAEVAFYIGLVLFCIGPMIDSLFISIVGGFILCCATDYRP